MNFNVLNSLRFTYTAPTSYTQTRFIDLRPEVSDILALFNANGRVKLRIKDKHNNDVSIIGFYLKGAPLEPKAFITGVRHHHMVEFSVGGSRSDERLRKFPFNHILIWQLILRSKKQGGHLFDMGGISSEAAGDELQGISAFKRLFPGFELKVGSEMHLPLRPPRAFTYSVMQKISRALQ